MAERLTRTQHNFLADWLRINLLGWIMGVFCGLFLGWFILLGITFDVLSPNLRYQLEPILIPLIAGLPLAGSIALMQRRILRRLHVQATAWILATSFGAAVPTAFVSWYLHFQWELVRSAIWGPILYILGTIAIGTSIGISQAFVLDKSVSRSGLWILANSTGLLALGFLVVAMVGLAHSVKSIFLNFFYSQGLYELVRMRDLLLFGYVAVLLPFLGTIVMAIPTGLILLKYGNWQPTLEKEDAEALAKESALKPPPAG